MRFLVRSLDGYIRRSQAVFEFTEDEDCLLRLQVSRAPHRLMLPNLVVDTDEQVLQLHLWNERMHPFTSGSPDLVWASRLFRRFDHSLRLAATYLSAHPELSELRAVGGVTILLTSGLHEAGSHFVQKMGFSVFPYHNRLGRFGEFWENFFSWMIIWTFNPDSFSDRSLLGLRRSEMWMSREAFLDRYDKKP